MQNEVHDKTVDIAEEILKKIDLDKLQKAISRLKPSEQELLHKLYLDKQTSSQVSIANLENINVSSIKMKLKRIKTKLKNFL